MLVHIIPIGYVFRIMCNTVCIRLFWKGVQRCIYCIHHTIRSNVPRKNRYCIIRVYICPYTGCVHTTKQATYAERHTGSRPFPGKPALILCVITHAYHVKYIHHNANPECTYTACDVVRKAVRWPHRYVYVYSIFCVFCNGIRTRFMLERCIHICKYVNHICNWKPVYTYTHSKTNNIITRSMCTGIFPDIHQYGLITTILTTTRVVHPYGQVLCLSTVYSTYNTILLELLPPCKL